MLKTIASLMFVSSVVAAAGCKGGGGAGSPLDATTGVLVPAYADRARAIADEYAAWGRVDDELRWAPFLCRIPLPGVARPSESNDPTTHGQKLYSVFAKNQPAYPAGPFAGQVVVKESWRSELVTGADGGYAPQSWRPENDGGDHFYPYAQGDGGVYRASEKAGLYLMWKVDPLPDGQGATYPQDTDEGWVYATILPSGEVTSAGRVASCMGCHESAEHERLFGVPTAP